MAWLSVGGEDAAFEGDGEGVECTLPSVRPAFLSLAGGVKITHQEVETLQCCLFGGEMTLARVALRILAFGDSTVFVSGMKWGDLECGAAPGCRFARVGFGVLRRNR